MLRWRHRNKHAQGRPQLGCMGSSNPRRWRQEGQVTPPPWWWCLVGELGFLGGFWLVTCQSGTSYLCFRGATKWATQACTMPLMAILMAIAMRRYYTPCITRWWRFMAFIKATKNVTIGQAPLAPIIPNRICQRRLFWTFHLEKRLQLTCWPLTTIGVWHIKLMRSA